MIKGFFRATSMICLILLFTCLAPAHSANINVPSFELYTKGVVDDGRFGLQSEGEIDFLIEGGYKFSGRIVLGFNSENLEQDLVYKITRGQLDATGLSFTSASITLRELFSAPLAFTFFIGRTDIFASGKSFSDVFGVHPFETQYRGFLYFSGGTRYDGIHRVAGTGANL